MTKNKKLKASLNLQVAGDSTVTLGDSRNRNEWQSICGITVSGFVIHLPPQLLPLLVDRHLPEQTGASQHVGTYYQSPGSQSLCLHGARQVNTSVHVSVCTCK